MQILDGKKLSEKIARQLTEQISPLSKKPKLVIFQIGNNKFSEIYISRKIKFAQKIGAIAEVLKFDESIETTELIGKIKKVNEDNETHGIIVQLPIPKTLDKSAILTAIDPKKDIDGMTPTNRSKLFQNDSDFFVPATTRGIAEIFIDNNIDVTGKKIVIIGRSDLVGKPTAIYFLNKNATVTICHSYTDNLADFTKNADIIISAVGKPGILTKDHVTKNQIIVDVGISTDRDGKIRGDVSLGDFEVKMISPVPGGVGPMTVASLFNNLLDAYRA
ncbi:MAG TPA: bifunctional 5,10-methylenetetrahydrofolate dehydrogenase/5,10-methenyltetrahydrofolate cyclohydrolase [Candidatus Paceibacterota bacterium]|nr:bifunctional 5,10-methylenetetrahydrofolate dehydrogenase/5,10-methenyltetrahydrofolate cyclohydrolase [Candidatus Paceibacterota bacterium]